MGSRLGTLAILAVMVMQSPAEADKADHNANYFLPGCRDFANKEFGKAPFLAGECVGVLEGLSLLARDLTPGFEIISSCVPENATLGQMATVVLRWLDQHPARWHEDFRSLALLSLHDAWPCPTSK